MNTHTYIACDLGAESGRVMLGHLENGKLRIEEIHRFTNGATRLRGTLRWDIMRIFDELKVGLKKVGALKIPAASLSVDSWGVDYVLFNDAQPVLATPYQYRDTRTDAIYECVMKSDLPALIFEETGIQFMSINTLYQLIADVEENGDVLSLATGFLPIADYLHWLFSGAVKAEESLASTTQAYNPRTRTWSSKLIARINFPARLLPDVVPSGTKLGPLLADIAAETGLTGVEVVATCSHDTGAAVAAVPAQGDDWAYLSSGTWSLMGVEWPKPVINEQSRTLGFTNEIGFGDSVRLLKNIVGLWIVQECRRQWAKEGKKYDYAALEKMAADAPPFVALINPDDARFLAPDNMVKKIAEFCTETRQPVPANDGAYVRCIYESLALFYRITLRKLEKLTGKKIEQLHIVGGGSQATTLNQCAANALKIPVLAGPTECTALGNILVQAIALGHLPSLPAARDVVKNSFELKTFTPQNSAEWDAAATRFEKLIA
jgi:rhamnulokinase